MGLEKIVKTVRNKIKRKSNERHGPAKSFGNMEVKNIPPLVNSADETKFQLGFINVANEVKGTQIGYYNECMDERVIGAQLGVLANFTDYLVGAQLGCLNVVGVGVRPVYDVVSALQLGVFFNFVDDTKFDAINGVQIGGLASLSSSSVAGIDYKKSTFNGLQIAPFCYAGNGNYLQLGLITVRGGKDRPWYKRFSPLIGFSQTKK